MRRIAKLLALLVLLVVVAFAVIGVQFLTRGTPVTHVRMVERGTVAPRASTPELRRTVGLLTGTPVVPGHDVEVLSNGHETYPRLYADLASAQQAVMVQMYYANPGRVADSVKALLIERARRGVRAYFLIDAFGAQNMGDGYLDSLRSAGVNVARLRPLRWYALDKVSRRSHVRVVSVDGRVGYTGGFGIDDKWLGGGRRENEWRDVNARFTGPAVQQLQAAFAAGWAEATGVLLTGGVLFPDGPAAAAASGDTGATPARGSARPPADSGAYAGLLYAAPSIGSTPAERFLALSFASARRTMYIANSYFVPDDDLRRLLTDAAARGVDVRLLMTSHKTDVKTTWYAGRARYEELLEGGVRIYEYQPTMMHAKTFVIDGMWSTVGTINIDNRSLAYNDESNLMVHDAAVGAVMDSLFLADLRYAREITLPEFRRRRWTQRVLELSATLISRLL
jgi:cardiolipin synthase